MDAWTKEQVETMKSVGNVKSNALYNPNEARNPPPANLMDVERDSDLEQYIRSKYQFKRFIDKSVLVTSKLGPPGSSASVTLTNSPVTTSVVGRRPLNDSSSAPPTPLTSAVSSPSISNHAPQTMAPRRSTLATAAPTPAVSQPSTPQYARQPQTRGQTQPSGTSSANVNGVWADLISLQTPSSTSSLPLQFQTPSPSSSIPQGYQTTGINPFQQQHLAVNPYSQQSFHTSGLPSPSLSSGTPFSTSTQQQSFFASQPLMSAPAQNTSNFFQPQPQQGSGHAFFAAGNAQGNGVTSASAIQGHFLSTSPAQFPSDSPVSTTPQPHMFSTTPQPQMFSTTTQPQSQAASQMMFMTTPSQQFQMQQQGGLGVGSLQTQSQTSMIMGQMPFGAGAQVQSHMMAMQTSGQFGGAFQQPFSASGFSGGQQWGPM